MRATTLFFFFSFFYDSHYSMRWISHPSPIVTPHTLTMLRTVLTPRLQRTQGCLIRIACVMMSSSFPLRHVRQP